jgi:hypothetical protein
VSRGRYLSAAPPLEEHALVADRPSESPGSDKDIKPFHAKETTTGQEAADAVAAVLKHAAARDEAAKKKAPAKPQPIWMLPLGLTLAVLATFLLVAPPPWVVVNPIAAQAPEDALEKTRNAIWWNAQKIEGYQIQNGRLPQTLAEAGINADGLDYTPLGNGYLLSSQVGEEPVVFNSTFESLATWAAREVNIELGG